MGQVNIVAATPGIEDLPRLLEVLSSWQIDPWVGHLHPGDIGWHSMVGTDRLMSDLRLWGSTGADPLAIAMVDGEVIRFAMDPGAVDDPSLAAVIARDLTHPETGIAREQGAVIEARGARALRSHLLEDGWGEDDPWTPLSLDLAAAQLPPTDGEAAPLRVHPAQPEDARAWTAVHWSAFRGVDLDEETHQVFTERWATMCTGPLAAFGHHLMGHDRRGAPAAVLSVWSAGAGRPALIEPLGVHRGHQGSGHGLAITTAAARHLHLQGASSAVVVAENSNEAAMRTYRAAGFTAHEAVRDLTR